MSEVTYLDSDEFYPMYYTAAAPARYTEYAVVLPGDLKERLDNANAEFLKIQSEIRDFLNNTNPTAYPFIKEMK